MKNRFSTWLAYLLLAGGSLVFLWPFLWMMGTSFKLDREVFVSQISPLPFAPRPIAKSPHYSLEHFQGRMNPRAAALIPALEKKVASLDLASPDGTPVPSAVRKEIARGLATDAATKVPVEIWEGPADNLERHVVNATDADAARAILARMRRELGIGQLRARSWNLEETVLAGGDLGFAGWRVEGAQLVPPEGPGAFAVLHYDFSGGGKASLEGTFQTSFPLERLHRLQWEYHPDESWNPLVMVVEMGGVRYRTERPLYLYNREPAMQLFQRPGPDDRSFKVHNWLLLHEIARGEGIEARPNHIKVRIELSPASAASAWWAKLSRNYIATLNHIPFWRYVATSVFLVIVTVAATLFSCSLVAYSFARLQWPGRGFCFALMLATMMIPPQVTMIPNFIIMQKLGWYNTLLPLWVPHLFASAFYVFLLRQFLKGIPKDLEDAARIDGCGFWRIYWHVMLPLVRPTLAVIAIFTFMGTWNDFMGPLIFLSDQNLYPLSFGLFALNVQAGGSLTMMMAGSLLMTLPVIVLFFFAQRYFMQGVTLTGMKG